MSRSREWDAEFSINHERTTWLVRTLGALCSPCLPASQPMRVLDLGCGCGTEALDLADRFPQAEVVGVDISEPNIVLARRQAQLRELQHRVSFHCGDYREVSFPKEHFALVVADNVLHFIPNDHGAVVKKIADELMPGGQFSFSIPYRCLHNAFLCLVRSSIRAMRSRWSDALIFWVARLLHRRDCDLAYLRQRVHYMYLTPTHWHSDRFQAALADLGLTMNSQQPYPHGSAAQMRCRFWVYQKSSDAWNRTPPLHREASLADRHQTYRR